MKFNYLLKLGTLAFCLSSCSSQSTGSKDSNETTFPVITKPTHMFVGGYTRDEGWVNGNGTGIYRVSIAENRTLTIDGSVAEVTNPSFIAVSPDLKNLYAVSELGRGDEPTGYVHAFTINEDLSLTFINKYPTNAKSPAHVSVDATGTMVFAANYQGGVAMVYERNSDGSLSFKQQLDHPGSGSHTHMVKVSPDNDYLFIPDLGNDKVWSYKIDHNAKTVSKTSQEAATFASGAGPRHMDFHPTKNIAYVINELNSTVTVFSYNPSNGALTELQTISTLPTGFSGNNSTADIHVHPNGKFLYGSNRGHNSIVSFSIDDSTGEISPLAYTPVEGEIPRNFALTPDGNFLYAANQNSRSITSFSLNAETGLLTFTGNTLAIGTPTVITFYQKD